ncbi:uncharacterized protein LOC129724576 [Wyeomyia smithii]|uniref:uncharacterized protein LOC129724576 n=1 Tax=Wyeomyia smithii TaxID=174621 RepID=UPI002467F7E5|nr:uncharacterized protein LOC129724576 [Wyeomyia smithii]
MLKAMGKSGSSVAALILLIAVGLVAQVSNEEIEVGDPEEKSAAQQYFDAVAPEYRETFLKYHLDKGLERRIPNHVSATPDDFDSIPFQTDVTEPENFSINLLNHFERTVGFRDRDVYNYVKYNTVCTPAGVCFNPGDVGTICCPF